MTIKMIPSHAVYLALLTGRNIYVKKELVDQQERFEEYEEGE
jgi:bifunctional DNase/RNase